MRVGKYQRLPLEAYPAIEMLGYFGIDDTRAIADAVHSKDGVGDGLFSFLWKDLADCTTDEEALERLDSALRDLNAIRSAIAS